MSAWGHLFPEALVEWGPRQPPYIKVPGSGGISVVHTLLSTAVRQDPDTAWQLAREVAATPCVVELPPGAARTRVFQELSRYYVDRFGTIEEAAAWFQTLPQEARQQVAAAAQSASDFQYTICPKENLEQLRQAWPLPE